MIWSSFTIENEQTMWEVIQILHTVGFGEAVSLENAQQDIYEAKQLRLAICQDSFLCGRVNDLFDFDQNNRAGVVS
jgi:diamine N-acetyltransferase